MLYHYLLEFTVAAKEQSLAKAARRLFMSQSVLSRHLDALEMDLGTKLAIRGPRGLKLTTDGRYVLGRALDIIEIGEDIKAHLLATQPEQRTITIGGVIWDTGLLSRILDVLPSMTNDSGQKLSVRFISAERTPPIEKALTGDTADIRLVFAGDKQLEELDADYGVCEVSRDDLIVIVGAEHPFAKCKSIVVEDLADQTIVHGGGEYLSAYQGWEYIKRMCQSAGFAPKSRTVPFDEPADQYSTQIEDDILVIGKHNEYTQLLLSIGNVGVPIRDQAFILNAVYRKDDSVVARLLAGIANDAVIHGKE